MKIYNADEMLKDLENLKTERNVSRFLKKYKFADYIDIILVNHARRLMKGSEKEKGIMIINKFLKAEKDEIMKYIVSAVFAFETGETEKGKEFLRKIATETTDNYEESLEFRGWLDEWNKYKHLVKGEIPKSKVVNGKADSDELSDDELMDLFLEEVHSGGYDAYLSYNAEHFERTLEIAKARKLNGLAKQLERIKAKFPNNEVPENADEIIEKLNLNFDDEDELFYSQICNEFELT